MKDKDPIEVENGWGKSSVIAMLEPHTAAELNIDDIKAMCDELIEAQGNYMSMYKIKR